MQIVTVEHGNVDVDLFLYDFGGQSIFHQREMAKEYQKDATYILCVYDISSRTSLQSISTWLASVRSVVGQKIPAILVANKIDAIYIYIYSSIIFLFRVRQKSLVYMKSRRTKEKNLRRNMDLSSFWNAA
eukprot:994619_1